MPNEPNAQLRQAIQDAGIEPEELATQIQVDNKTIERWLAGRNPYPRYRSRVARALDREQHELWPHLATAPSDTALEQDDNLVTLFADADDPYAPDWRSLLEQATERIDLLDLTLTHIINNQDVVDLLAEQATAGCQIRILVSSPESAHLTITESERDPNQRLAARPQLAADVEHTLELLQPLRALDRVQIRTFVAPGYNTILRANDQLLVNLHLWGKTVADSALLHLQADQQPGLFAQFAHHYQAIWATASKSA